MFCGVTSFILFGSTGIKERTSFRKAHSAALFVNQASLNAADD